MKRSKCWLISLFAVNSSLKQGFNFFVKRFLHSETSGIYGIRLSTIETANELSDSFRVDKLRIT